MWQTCIAPKVLHPQFGSLYDEVAEPLHEVWVRLASLYLSVQAGLLSRLREA